MAKNQPSYTSIRLRECRIACGLSQQKIADILNIDRTTYTYYESGRNEPNLKTLVKLAEILSVPASYLLPPESDDVSFKDSLSSTLDIPQPLNADELYLLRSFRTLSKEEQRDILAKITNMTKPDM